MLPTIFFAQQAFKHTTTKTNTNSHITTLDHVSVNNNPGAIIIVTHDYGEGVYNNNAIGVWYAGNKWRIFNQNRAAMPENSQFNVLAVENGDNAFLHLASVGNTSGHITTLDHPKLNNNANAKILVTARFGSIGNSYNPHPIGVYYARNKWRIFNQDMAAISENAQFNVYINEQTELITIATPRGNWGKIGSANTKGKKDFFVFATQNWLTLGPYNAHEIGVRYDQDDWAVYNEDQTAMPKNAKFNVLAISNIFQYTPITGKGGNEPPQPSPEEMERKGPRNISTFEWKNYIGSEYSFPNSYPLVNVYFQLYGDANLKSGYFYYLPKSYTLNRSSVNGYALYIRFLSSTSGSRGEAMVTAELTPNISNKDLVMAGKLLEADLKNKPGLQFIDLVSAPLSQPPRISINQISSFGIEENNVSVTRPSNMAEPITISWRMQNVENLMTALFETVGLRGNLFLTPVGENMPEISIPFNIKLNSQNTFGKFELNPLTWRSTPWVNYTPYPVILKNVHIIKTNKTGDNALTVYTWQTGNTEVPPGAQVNFDAADVPAWVDNHASIQRIWLEYEVGACKFCDDKVENDMIGGAKGSRSRNLTFDVFDPLSYTEARLIKLRIRSVQADPNTRSKVNLPTLTISTDNITLDGGTIYVPEGSRPEFEYSLQLIMPDGTIHESDSWEVSDDPDTNIIGQALIRRLVSSFIK